MKLKCLPIFKFPKNLEKSYNTECSEDRVILSLNIGQKFELFDQ